MGPLPPVRAATRVSFCPICPFLPSQIRIFTLSKFPDSSVLCLSTHPFGSFRTSLPRPHFVPIQAHSILHGPVLAPWDVLHFPVKLIPRVCLQFLSNCFLLPILFPLPPFPLCSSLFSPSMFVNVIVFAVIPQDVPASCFQSRLLSGVLGWWWAFSRAKGLTLEPKWRVTFTFGGREREGERHGGVER